MKCPSCGSEDLSFDGPGFMADAEGPNVPLVCEDCGWFGSEEETDD